MLTWSRDNRQKGILRNINERKVLGPIKVTANDFIFHLIIKKGVI